MAVRPIRTRAFQGVMRNGERQIGGEDDGMAEYCFYAICI